MKILDSGVIFRNPLPGHRVINAIFPNPCVLDEGEILCLARVGLAMYSVDGVLEFFRSIDGGQTWQREGPPIDTASDAVQFNYRVGDQTRLRDGSLLLKINRAPHPDPDVLYFNQQTGGTLATEACYLRSEDRGHIWSQPVTATLAEPFEPQHAPEASGRVIELEDGSWFQLYETWKHHDDGGPFDLNSYGMFSTDGGRTWGQRVPVAVGRDENRSYSHGMPTQLDDGRVYISLWAAESQLQESFDLYRVRSTDASCRRWTEPAALSIPGQSSASADMGGGRVLIIYSHRENTEQPGIKVVLSTDYGDTFDVSDPLVVWDAYGKESLGVSRTNTYPSSHDAIAYGAPRIVRLNEQHALAVFWCTQGADTHCRWCRIQLS